MVSKDCIISGMLVVKSHQCRYNCESVSWFVPIFSDEYTYKIDIASVKLLQARIKRNMQALGMVTLGITSELRLVAVKSILAEPSSELGGNDHLISDATLLHPLSEPLLALFVLIVVGRVDKVAALLVEEVEDLKSCLLVARAHEILPGVAKVHGSQT